MVASTATVCCLLLLEVCITAQQQIVVEPNEECDTSSSLDQALQNITSDTIISLASGIHCLTDSTAVEGVSNITLTGQDTNGSVIITCSDGVGLAFVNISSLYVHNLQIQSCGVSGDNLRKIVNLTQYTIQLHFAIPSNIHIALYLASVTDLLMDHVIITNTTGLGLVGINIIGESQLQHCQFSYNAQQLQQCTFAGPYVTNRAERIGGGAYFLFQDFVGSDISSCRNISVHSLVITESNFLGNSECSDLASVEFNYRDSRQARSEGYTIGGGGGLGVMVTQVCYGINITTVATVFEENSATFGSGAHVGFFQGVSDSYVIFDDCQFTGNGYPTSEFNLSFVTHGGAIGLYNDLVSPDPSVPVFIHNRNVGLIVKNSNFTNNGAISGGAVIIISLVTTAVADLTDVAHFYFDNCVFVGNRAAYGAAIFIEELKLHARILGIQVRANDLMISQNVIETLGDIAPIASADSSAAFAVQGINMSLTGNCVFDSNIGSALQGSYSYIGIDGNIVITNNTGLYGAGIIIQFSFLIVLPNSTLDIINNVARIYGGALFVNQNRNSPLVAAFDCFLYFDYDQLEYCDTCDFTTSNFTMRLVNNTAALAGTVYGSALITCPWAIALKQKYNRQNVLEILDTHFSDHFQFTPNPTGTDNVQSPVSRVIIEDQEPEYSLAPGQSLPIDIRPQDSLGESISSLLGVYVDLDQDVPPMFAGVFDEAIGISGYVADSNNSTPLTVFGAQSINTTMIIYGIDVLGNRPAQNQIRVRVLGCPVGFEYSDTRGRCVCSEELLDRDVECSSADLTLTVPSGVWVGPVDDSRFAVADCIRGLCQPGAVTLSVRNNTIDFDQQCRPELNRGGVLCGSCLDGYTNVFGGMQCTKCSNDSAAIIILFLLLGALVIMFLVVFRVNLSSGYLNGILLWANIVSLYENILAPSQSQVGIGFLTHLLTLIWGDEVCFHEGMSALEKSWWQLSFPLYLFFLMIALRACFKGRCCHKVSSKTALATIEAIATLLILCYISILRISFALISTVKIYTDNRQTLLRWAGDPTVIYFRGGHGFLAFLACVLIAFYLLPMPLIFLFPTVLYKNKYLKKYKPFYDTFWNPFKPQFRFWLGLRLIFRWIPLIAISFSTPPTSTFVTLFFLTVLLFLQMQLQPFQSKWVNTIDNLFLLNLMFLFVGSLFFNATIREDLREQQTINRATTYTTIFVVVAYIGIIMVFICGLFVRFPKLKECLGNCFLKCREKKKKLVLRVPQSPPDDTGYMEGVPNVTIQQAGRSRVIGQTFFRESLLEDAGSVEIETYIRASPDHSPPNTSSTYSTKTTTNSE